MDEKVNPLLVTLVSLLSNLYKKICNCRRDYEELEDLLPPKFHLEDCPYRQNLEKNNINF